MQKSKADASAIGNEDREERFRRLEAARLLLANDHDVCPGLQAAVRILNELLDFDNLTETQQTETSDRHREALRALLPARREIRYLWHALNDRAGSSSVVPRSSDEQLSQHVFERMAHIGSPLSEDRRPSVAGALAVFRATRESFDSDRTGFRKRVRALGKVLRNRDVQTGGLRSLEQQVNEALKVGDDWLESVSDKSL